MQTVVIPMLAGSAVVATVLAIAMLQQRTQPIARRARQMASGLSARDRATAPAISRQQRMAAHMQGFFQRIGIADGRSRRRLVDRLAEAGMRGGEATTVLEAAWLIIPTLGALLGYGMAPWVLTDPDPTARLAVALVGLALGAAVPRLWLTNRIRKRQAALARALPDALDLYVICAEAGLSLDAAMARVARELKPAAPALADELQLTAIELGFLPDRHDAFANLLKRAPLPAFRGLVGMFQQTERYGTPLADALRLLAAEYRTESLMKAEEKAARLPAILTVPMIVFVLPPLFIVLVGPAIIQVLGAG